MTRFWWRVAKSEMGYVGNVMEVERGESYADDDGDERWKTKAVGERQREREGFYLFSSNFNISELI